MKLIKEFQAFAMRGNVVDMAVGIVIGTAFGKIVSSLVADVVMPPIGMLLGKVDFSNLKIVLKKATIDAAGKAAGGVSINYGAFVSTVLDFVIIAAAIFMVIKAMNSMKRKAEKAPTQPPPPPKQEQLLTEIRDILKTR